MILVDRDIKAEVERGRIKIDPYDEAMVQPSSYDFHLANQFLVFDPQAEVIDPRAHNDYMVSVYVDEDRFFVLHPGQFALGASVERFTIADDLVGQVNGKSSLGRMGLQIHATAGFFDPGWDGVGTLELSNVAPLPIRLYPGDKIGQMVFMQGSSNAERPYGHPSLRSKYKGAETVQGSRFHMERPPPAGIPPEVMKPKEFIERSNRGEFGPQHRPYYAGQEHGLGDPWAG